MKRTVFGARNAVLGTVIVWAGVVPGTVADGQTFVPRPVRPATPQESAATVADPLTIPAEVPLRVEATQTVRLKPGQVFQGKLVEPVYGPDRLLLPVDSVVHGVVAATPAADRSMRVYAKLDGDFTPLRVPVIRVTEVVLPSGVAVPVIAEGGMRNTVLTLAKQPQKTSILGQIKAKIHEQVQQVRDARHDPHKGDRLKQLLYSQLPYHPQRLWAGSAFDAVLRSPAVLPNTAAGAPIALAGKVDLSTGTMETRLAGAVSSKSARKGDAVSAFLIKPLCNAKGEMMLPTGTMLHGAVLQAQPARWFARSGHLRYSFRSVDVPGGETGPGERIQGDVSSLRAAKGENIALDAEADVHAQPDKGRFLNPIVLGVMAAASQDDDAGIARQGVTSNGFGLAARVVTMATASRNASTGFAAFAFSKSIYRHWIARGREISLPENTEMTIKLGRR